MAFFPCDAGPHYNPTKNFLVYVGVTRGNNSDRYKLRFCRAHLSGIQEDLTQYEVITDSSAVGPGSLCSDCLACGQPVDKLGRNVFVTCYPPENERKDYWARVHDHCSLPVWTGSARA